MEVKIKKEDIALLLFLGSVWGLSEVLLGGFLYGIDVPYSSVILSIIAMFILSLGYSTIKKPFIPSLIALIAVIFRFVNAGPFYCHLLAIFLLGVGFDIVALVIKKEKYVWLRGFLSAWLGYVLFAFVITYVIRYHYWTAGGIEKVMRYIGVEGSMAALGAFVSVSLGYRVSSRIDELLKGELRLVSVSITGVTILLWIMGILI